MIIIIVLLERKGGVVVVVVGHGQIQWCNVFDKVFFLLGFLALIRMQYLAYCVLVKIMSLKSEGKKTEFLHVSLRCRFHDAFSVPFSILENLR